MTKKWHQSSKTCKWLDSGTNKKNSHKKYRDMNGAGSIQMLVISSLRWKSPTASIKKWSDLNIKAFFTAQILKFQSRKITNVDNLLDLVTEAATGTPKLLFLLLEITCFDGFTPFIFTNWTHRKSSHWCCKSLLNDSLIPWVMY